MKRILLCIGIILFNLLSAGDPVSSFTKIDKDITVNSTVPVAVITKEVRLTKAQNVLIVADGSFLGSAKQGKAQITIMIDKNTSASSNSVIDWGNTNIPLPHSFNSIASAKLKKGVHTIKLIASVHPDTPGTDFKIGKGSGMSVLVDAAPYMISSKYENTDLTINLDSGRKGGVSPLPVATVLTNQVNVGPDQTNVVSLASGSSYRECGEGDALWGIFLNGEDCINNGNSQWSVNDILRGAEFEAPMFLHSLHSVKGNNLISLKAGELSFKSFENPVCYKIEKNARLVSLYGMKISGKAPITNTYCNREEWAFFGSTSRNNEHYKQMGVPHPVVSTEIDIPQGHNGIVLFLSKVRLQPDAKDEGGTVTFWINIDGVDVGTLGVQGYKRPNGDSSRTISTSYLSAGANKLSAGKHRVTVYIKAEGDFIHIAHSLDLPLIYFD